MTNQILIAIASAFLILAGAAGSVLPVLPGPPLAFGGLFLYAWYTGYETITPLVLAIFGILTGLTFLVDFLAPALGAKSHKASRPAVIGAFAGAFAGVFVLGPIGILAGPVLGAFLGELFHARDFTQAGRIAWGSFIGFMVGSAFKLVVIAAMLGYLVYAWF